MQYLSVTELGYTNHVSDIGLATPHSSLPFPVILQDAVDVSHPTNADAPTTIENQLPPSNIEEAVARIRAYYSSGVSEPMVMRIFTIN